MSNDELEGLFLMSEEKDINKTIEGYRMLIDYHIQHLHKLNEDLKIIVEIRNKNERENTENS